MAKSSLRHLTAISILTMFALAACSSSSSARSGVNLEETVKLVDFGFTMDYPAGWEVQTYPPIIILHDPGGNQDLPPEDFEIEKDRTRVVFDYVDLTLMRDLGLKRNATLQELLRFNKIYFAWLDPMEVDETKIFDVQSLRVRKQIGDEWSIHFIGFRNDAVFLFGIIAPSEAALDDFTPIWDAMIDSISPVSG